MRLRPLTRRWILSLSVAASAIPALALAPAELAQNKKPSISVKVNPRSGFSPLRVVATAELTGGPNDFQDFYCASVEWDWGDGTKSESTQDCDPFEAGKSEIKRRFAQEHVFNASAMTSSASPTSPFSSGAATDMNSQQAIQFRVRFTLKQKNKTVGSSQATVEVRPGLRDGGLR